jgi:hypothetical protein
MRKSSSPSHQNKPSISTTLNGSIFSLIILRHYSLWLVHSTPAASNPSSPSTNTHQPSDPRPPSPAITASKCDRANSSTALSNVPGCSQTAGIPTEWASCNRGRVTAGGVTTDKDVCAGDSRAEGDATVL